MTLRSLLTLLLPVLAIALPMRAQLPQSSPAEAGINAEALAQLISTVHRLPNTELHHLVVVGRGHIVAQVHCAPYRAHDVHTQFSACKMLTALGVGLAVQDRRLSPESRVVDLLPESVPPTPSPQLSAMTVRHLLTMTSGMAENAELRYVSSHWVADWLAQPLQQPGRHFTYDSMCSYLLAAIVQRVTGQTLLELLDERILRPMGIDDAQWERSPEGINTGGWGFRTSTLSMAMLGQLMLQRGQWQGRQLIDADWIDQMSHDQLQPLGIALTHKGDYGYGYGYQVMMCSLPGVYRAQGNMGQLLLMDTTRHVVVAINSVTADQIALLRTVQQLLPRLVDDGHADARSRQRLDTVIGGATLPMIGGEPWSDRNRSVWRCSLPDNRHYIRSIAVRRTAADQITLRLDYADGDSAWQQTVTLGHRRWAYGTLQGTPPYYIWAQGRFSGLTRPFTVAGNYGWHAGGLLEMQLHYVDWYSALRLTVDLERRQVTIADNQTPYRIERLTAVVAEPEPGSADRGARAALWMAAFGLLGLGLLIAIARSCYAPLSAYQK